mgnify:CR=1 FL=1
MVKELLELYREYLGQCKDYDEQVNPSLSGFMDWLETKEEL